MNTKRTINAFFALSLLVMPVFMQARLYHEVKKEEKSIVTKIQHGANTVKETAQGAAHKVAEVAHGAAHQVGRAVDAVTHTVASALPNFFPPRSNFDFNNNGCLVKIVDNPDALFVDVHVSLIKATYDQVKTGEKKIVIDLRNDEMAVYLKFTADRYTVEINGEKWVEVKSGDTFTKTHQTYHVNNSVPFSSQVDLVHPMPESIVKEADNTITVTFQLPRKQAKELHAKTYKEQVKTVAHEVSDDKIVAGIEGMNKDLK